MTIIQRLKEILREYDRLFYIQRHFHTFTAIGGIILFILTMILRILPWTSWPWTALIWTLTAGGYFICRIRWFQADSDIIGSALEKFNRAFPINTNERKIALYTLEEMSSVSTTAAMIVALFGGKHSLHYYYGWSEPPAVPQSGDPCEIQQQIPAAKKRVTFSGIIPLQTKDTIPDLRDCQTNDKCIRLDPDRPGRKIS